MEGIPIFYVMQPSVDDTLNVFYLPPQIKSQSDVKIQDVVNNFPHKNSGKFYHYRFYALCDKDQKTWVDISNLGAKAPVVDNKILVKILELAQPQYSKIFASLYTGKSNTNVSNGAQQRAPEQPQSQQQRPAPQQNTQQRQQPQPSHQQQTQNRPAPQQNTQQRQQAPPVNNPKPQAADDFDLLGGFGGPSTSSSNVNVTQTTTTTKTSVSFGSPPEQEKKDNSALHNMTRSQLDAYKQQQMDQAIQDKLDFAKKVWEDEEKNKEEKHLAYAELEDMIKKWAGKDKQRNNIRALLCTLQDVVWPESGWVPLSFSDLMQPAQIKKSYFKAITRFHPDKNQHVEFKQKYISERVTNELNAAWDEHRKTNP